MCGRYKQDKSAEVVARHFRLKAKPEIKPRYNIAPGQLVLTVVQDEHGEREGVMKKWGLVPRVAEKRSFKKPLRKRRCLFVSACGHS